MFAAKAYFGCTFGSPPGLPGGGITGVLPVSGVGARISGSMHEGGQSTPSDRASLSPSGSLAWPMVVPSGATESCGALGRVGAHSAERCAAGGAVCCGGVAGAGGACAIAAVDAVTSRLAMTMVALMLMRRQRSPRRGRSASADHDLR